MLIPTVTHHHAGPRGAETAIQVSGTEGYHCFGSQCLPQTVGLRVIGAHYQWLSSMLSMSDRSEGSWHSQHGR